MINTAYLRHQDQLPSRESNLWSLTDGRLTYHNIQVPLYILIGYSLHVCLLFFFFFFTAIHALQKFSLMAISYCISLILITTAELNYRAISYQRNRRLKASHQLYLMQTAILTKAFLILYQAVDLKS